jgi:hypothetical protein
MIPHYPDIPVDLLVAIFKGTFDPMDLCLLMNPEKKALRLEKEQDGT